MSLQPIIKGGYDPINFFNPVKYCFMLVANYGLHFQRYIPWSFFFNSMVGLRWLFVL